MMRRKRPARVQVVCPLSPALASRVRQDATRQGLHYGQWGAQIILDYYQARIPEEEDPEEEENVQSTAG